MQACPSASNQRLTRAKSPFPAACGRSSGSGQIRSSIGSRWVFAYVNANSMALRWRRHATVQQSGIEIKKSGKESSAIVQSPPPSPRSNRPGISRDASDSSHASRRNPSTKDVRSPSCSARTDLLLDKSLPGRRTDRGW